MGARESSSSRHGSTPVLLITGILVSMAVSLAYLIHPSFINSTNNRTTDAVLALVPAKQASGAVVIVDIDENSLAGFGQWPWPRSLLARLLETINAAGAASIGMDMLLAEPDRTPPGNATTIHDDIPDAYASDLGKLPDLQDNDLILAETLSHGPFVLGYDFLFSNGSPPNAACGLHPPGITWINMPEKDQDNFFTAQGAVCNRRIFSEAATNSGFLNATPDIDGVLRRIPMLIRFHDRLYPSLTLAMLIKQAKSNQVGVRGRESGRLDLMVENHLIPVDIQGNMIIRFSRHAQAMPRISAADLLNGKIPADQLHGKFVLIGLSAAGLKQIYQTPAGPIQSHAIVHAQALDNLITGQKVVRTRDFLSWEAVFGLLVAIGSGLSVARLTILPSAAVNLILLAGSWISAAVIFQIQGFLFSPLLPTILVLLNFTVLTIVKTLKVELEARKQAEDTLLLLKSSEKRLNSIINTIPDIIFRLDPADRITFISPAIAKYTANPESLIGKSIMDLVAPEDLAKAKGRLNEKRTGERATNGLELRLLLSYGHDGPPETPRYFSVSAEGIYNSDRACTDKFIGTQGILRDITEQKKLEMQLVNAQKLEAMGSLAARVAHDLNNILAGLVSYPDLLLLKLPPDSPLRDDIAMIQQSGQRAAAIVQDLLAMGRRGIQTPEILNLNTAITEYLASLEVASILKNHPGVTLETNLATDLLNMKGSKVNLTKALMNLLVNAAEAMPAGGKIVLASYNTYLEVPLRLYEEIPPGEYVCISVTDEGVGIIGEDFLRIFEPFYSKKSMKRSGSGLGMTVVWSTIKDHHGYIDLQSREGEGTQFVLYFPATRDQEELLSPRAVLEDYLGSERLLIVDDVPEQLKIAAGMLAKLGYEVTAMANGEAAVEHLRQHSADLVLLDMIMPGGMDGLETYRQILEIRPDQKAIITSGFSESEKVKAVQQLGAGTYVQKPYTLERLGLAVRRELDLPAR